MDIVCSESENGERSHLQTDDDPGSEMTVRHVAAGDASNVIVEAVNTGASIADNIHGITIEGVNVMRGVADDIDVQVVEGVTSIPNIHSETIQDNINSVAVEDVAIGVGDAVVKTETSEGVVTCITDAIEEGDTSVSSPPVPIECAVEDVDNIKVQVSIKILDQEIAGSAMTEDDPCLEPATKRFRVEGSDGQTYMLTMPSHLDGDAVAAMQGAPIGGIRNLHDPKQKVDVTQAWFTSRDDKTALTSKGQDWRQGQWSKDEVELLQANIATYCKNHGINDPTEIIFEMSKDERKDFYRTVAKGLQRPLFSVYRRVIRMYDQKNHVGKYTPEELCKLTELRAKYGTDWATIGSAMGRSASSVKDRCRLMKATCNSGKWLPEEEHRLTNVVYELTQARPGESVTQGISWSAVAEKVMTRSEKQCRTKWLNYLNWKEKGGADWTREDDIDLINRLASSEAADETQIDWVELCKGWESARSPQWLRGKWWSMKKHVQDYQLMSFQQIVQCLKHMQDSCFRGKLPGNSPAVRLRMTRSDIQKYQMMSNMTLQVPVSSVQGDLGDAAAAATIIPTSEEDVATNNLQYEILTQQLTPTSSGAYLITQPQNNPAISFATSNMATDHIIVHTLPISQLADTLRSNENVTVEMNPQEQQQVIISSADGIHTDCIDLHSLTNTDELTHAGELPQETQVEVSGHAEIIHENYVTQNVGEPPLEEEDHQPELDASRVVETADLVLGASSSPHYAQSTSSNDGDLIHLSSLSDPMLPTDGGDLMTSDVETEKVQHHDVEDS